MCFSCSACEGLSSTMRISTPFFIVPFWDVINQSPFTEQGCSGDNVQGAWGVGEIISLAPRSTASPVVHTTYYPSPMSFHLILYLLTKLVSTSAILSGERHTLLRQVLSPP